MNANGSIKFLHHLQNKGFHVKRKIDVEKLLQWTVREELPKGRPVSVSAWDLVARHAMLGVRIDGGGPVDPLGFVPGAPHEDALVVADAIKSLDDDFRLQELDDALLMLAPWNAIAGQAADALMQASFPARSLIVSRAALGVRPPWQFEAPECYQTLVPSAGGRPRALVEGFDDDGALVALAPNRGKAVTLRGLYDLHRLPRSPLQWLNPSMIQIGEARAEYHAWHQSLHRLAGALAGQLKEFEPVAPAAPALPWITGGAPAPRIIMPLNAASLDVLPLAPKRKAAGRPVESEIEALSRLRISQGRGRVRMKPALQAV